MVGPGAEDAGFAFHSGYGHTAVRAEGIKHGAEKAGQRNDAADAIVFDSLTYMGGASSAFAEATSGRYLTSVWADKIAAGFTNSAS
ncbi:hypothetical protein [Streptomyces mirabilis]